MSIILQVSGMQISMSILFIGNVLDWNGKRWWNVYILEQQDLSIVTTRFYSYYVFWPFGTSSAKKLSEGLDGERERERQRQTDRQTDRQTERFKWYRRCLHVQFCHRWDAVSSFRSAHTFLTELAFSGWGFTSYTDCLHSEHYLQTQTPPPPHPAPRTPPPAPPPPPPTTHNIIDTHTHTHTRTNTHAHARTNATKVIYILNATFYNES